MHIENARFLGEAVDVSRHFYEMINLYFIADHMTDFNFETLSGTLHFKRKERKGRMAFNAYSAPFEDSTSWNFPAVYADEPAWPVRFSFAAANAVRVQADFSVDPPEASDSPMIVSLPEYRGVRTAARDNGVVMQTDAMQVEVIFSPFSVVFRDAGGRLLTRTLNAASSRCLQNCNPLPLSYVRTNSDMKKYTAASFQIQPGEHFYGGGESFTPLDKRGQKLVLWSEDAHGCQTGAMYKPVPFYMSSHGYGVFAHTGAPVTLDFGQAYQEAQTVFTGEDRLDFFLFCGTPKEILAAYTALTGRSPVPPLWSFGLWMSRISYRSEEQVQEVARKLEQNRIPCDVIHLDTNWFEKDWCCDYRFSPTRFPHAQQMVGDLLRRGFHICLWQLPYFTPGNPYYAELIRKGYAVRDAEGRLPTEDAILDFSNPEAVSWYQDKLRPLLKMGVSAIKADFGEAAPLSGRYHSGRTGLAEHNLYPLRYNQAVAEAVKSVTGEPVIWARSAWAGSQRYPIHWGGDAENTNMAMLAELRGGLSLGMCGFSFWSHDSGGFVRKSPEELYARWNFMSIFTSHMRCHGAPPKEPWEYSPAFLELFRRQVETRYRLMPYLYAQSIRSARSGLPVLRSLFLEYPEDPACRTIEDQYFFGEDILVAPLFEDRAAARQVYLPKGRWMSLEDGTLYAGGQWREIPAGRLDGVALVREGAMIPVVDPALHTRDIDWKTLQYVWFTADGRRVTGTGIVPERKETFDCTEAAAGSLPVVQKRAPRA